MTKVRVVVTHYWLKLAGKPFFTSVKGPYNQALNLFRKDGTVHSVIETTCFGLYWPSSGFYNIKEEPIEAVKESLRGC
jgi:hypothetical protein